MVRFAVLWFILALPLTIPVTYFETQPVVDLSETVVYTNVINLTPTQEANTFSKSTTETLEKGLKFVQSQHYRHRMTSMMLFRCLSLILNIFYTFSSVSNVNFKQVTVCS